MVWDFNLELCQQLRGRSEPFVELKRQNISAVLHRMGLPFIPSYKPRSNAPLLLRKAVQKFVLNRFDLLKQVVDALEEAKTPSQKTFRAFIVEPPFLKIVSKIESDVSRIRLPRKVDFASRDESNRKFGRAEEQWVIEFEHRRLIDCGLAELFHRLDWVSDRLGAAGYDVLSYDGPGQPCYIEVKTTNAHASSLSLAAVNWIFLERWRMPSCCIDYSSSTSLHLQAASSLRCA